jgi:hypothetical protein
MNKALVERFSVLEKDVSQKKGPFALFALFAREDLPDRWDLIVAAPWAKTPQEGVSYLVAEIKRTMGAPALTDLSRIVFVAPSDPPVQAMNNAVHIQHGQAEIKDSNFFGLPIKHAWVITSQSLAPNTAK